MSRKRKVYVPNRSHHDFESATEFGDLVFLTEGRLPNRYQLNDLALMCGEKMQGAHQNDLLMIQGPTTLNCIAAAMLGWRFGRVNFLIYDQTADKYTQKTIVLEHTYAGSDK